ncbi:undecaprenyl/decaprenyl-phosphate alpha-N-acetylglucosaminyl 1-phosphate transferase [Lutibacter sp. HS1-25]|uniref:glycosyltransferase family 4 protein n=1 Tax=Lutibacter sp. HS1-25 TaxID=2485000 RepID=UPI00101257FD|nr:MraY family glycosyltransferase [Lutibacter sp. HS1-25]RXP61858.1 undecaprenyl/decaprenyl-phosphate alpha-N-acetylglucosaminyl 1-phosphate transferase [Lutibacter sp. HS1-25]
MFDQIVLNTEMMGGVIILISFFLVYFIIPKVIWINQYRNLMDDPDYRSSHKRSTPTMAGFSFFISLPIVLFFISNWDQDLIGVNYLASITIMFAIGLKDDLARSTPSAKIAGEVIAIFFILFNTNMHISSLEGFLNIYEIPKFLANILIVLTILTVINAYNLIDGIDGLAASIGVTIFSIYALIFYVIGLYFYFLLSLSLIGMLIAFLRYNISNSDKIFMGDTGSLIVGFSIGFLTLKFLSMNPLEFNHFTFLPENKIIIVVAILCIPLFDTFRVIVIRLLQKKSPFYPDRNHMHHVLIDNGFSHFNASFFLAGSNYIIVLILIYGSSLFNSFIMLGVLILIYTLFILMFYKLKQVVLMKNKQNS